MFKRYPGGSPDVVLWKRAPGAQGSKMGKLTPRAQGKKDGGANQNSETSAGGETTQRKTLKNVKSRHCSFGDGVTPPTGSGWGGRDCRLMPKVIPPRAGKVAANNPTFTYSSPVPRGKSEGKTRRTEAGPAHLTLHKGSRHAAGG